MKKLIFVLAIASLLFGCGDKESNISPGTQPALPSASGMSPDFEDFEEESGSGGRVLVVKNWAYAASHVRAYSGILKGSLIVPITAFRLAHEQKATFDAESNLWVWQ